MNLLDKLTQNLGEYKPKSSDSVADALERALEATTPSKAGTPWDKPVKVRDSSGDNTDHENDISQDTEDDIKEDLLNNILGR